MPTTAPTRAEQRADQRGDEQEERGGGEVDVEDATDRGGGGDQSERDRRLDRVLDGILTAHRTALTGP